jgi:MFS family permease
MNRIRWSALLDGVVYAALTILVWGVNALQRGLWQDDVQALGEAFRRSSHPFRTLFAPNPGPLRRLTILPSAIAWATPHPIWALHILCALIWLGHGLLAGWIVGLLLPGRRWTRFAVVCLTLTATSDFTAGSIVTLAYNMAALFLLPAVGCALLWIVRGRIVALIFSPILLACSLLTMEVALPAVPFLALLFVWRGGWRPTRRVVGLLAIWGVVLLPISIIEWSFLRDPTSYAAVALVPMSKGALIARAIKLWIINFAPWRWAFARPDWYARPHAVIPMVWMVAGALFAATLFLLRARRKEDGSVPEGVRLTMLFAVMALVANAAYAGVQFSELYYRTHILSRIWASAAIGILAGWFGMRWPRLRWMACAVVAMFVFFGTWGGIERQDYYLASWRGHQRELASILDAAASLRPGTGVILRSTTTSGRYLATEADYLTRHWLRLLYDDSKLQVMRLNPERGSGCKPAAAGIECWPEGQEVSYDNKARLSLFRFEELVVMDYDSTSGTYHLVRSFRGDPLARGYEGEAERYRPENRIVVRPWTVRQQRLLLLPRSRRGL